MTVTAKELRAMLVDGDELALLDVREEAEFGAEHILLAINVPLSQLETRCANLVPRSNTRIVMCDSGAQDSAVAHRAKERLQQYGYSEIHILDGGTAAWGQAGFELFSGMNVPSKLFGEFIEHHYGTPSLSAEELKAKVDANEDLVILDSRPMSEYEAMNIPGSTCMPGAELVFRVREIVPNTNTLVVVNCAGRTRSIIGAQSLINADIGNKVVALRNGTMGWHLAGYELERGQQRYVAEVSAMNGEEAQRHAETVAKRFNVRSIDHQTLNQWQQDPTRTVFLLDVRSPEEFVAGHVPGSISAPGGQLVQATDRYIGTLRATVVLIDDNGVRARMTASWLNQLGLHDVYVLERALFDSTLLRGPQRDSALGVDNITTQFIESYELAEQVASGRVAIIDLQRSLEFRKAHIAGAIHAVRGRIAERLDALPAHDLLVLTGNDDLLPRYAIEELSELTAAPVKVLRGGNQAWLAQGLSLVEGRDGLEDDPVDAFLRPYDRDKSVEEAMQSYLDWEIALMDKFEKDGTLSFKTA